MGSWRAILILAIVQGAAELLPVSSSAHVIVAAKLMGLDPVSPEMTFLLGNVAHAEIELLFGNLRLIAAALAAAGGLILYAGLRSKSSATATDPSYRESAWVGLVQGFCLPFRGFSRSGATISTALLLGIDRKRAEQFATLIAPGLLGAVFSLIAGLLALRLLSRVLSGGKWNYFGVYCLCASAAVFLLHLTGH